MDKPLYIFDLDGTLANIEHRKYILEDQNDSNRWRRFYDCCDKDSPNEPVIRTLELLRQSGADVWIFSGRSDEVRAKTVYWLTNNTSFLSHDLDTALVMRCAGDYTPDDLLKKQFLDNMLISDRKRLISVFDDRDRVVQMWRENGIACFQVASAFIELHKRLKP
jgi:hydroxymethylpyrimidine pyrophosphatase-like HAD family hydrolase